MVISGKSGRRLGASGTLVGGAANPSARSILPPIVGSWSDYGPADRQQSLFAHQCSGSWGKKDSWPVPHILRKSVLCVSGRMH